MQVKEDDEEGGGGMGRIDNVCILYYAWQCLMFKAGRHDERPNCNYNHAVCSMMVMMKALLLSLSPIDVCFL